MPPSRSNCNAAGTRASAKAKRSRSSTGDEWWLRPMTRIALTREVPGSRFQVPGKQPSMGEPGTWNLERGTWLSFIMQRRNEDESPKRQQQKSKRPDDAPGESPAALAETPARHDEH